MIKLSASYSQPTLTRIVPTLLNHLIIKIDYFCSPFHYRISEEEDSEDDDEDEDSEEESGEDFDSDELDDIDDDYNDDQRTYNSEETKSRFTSYSLTSSVIRRTEGLSLLDDRFEKVT